MSGPAQASELPSGTGASGAPTPPLEEAAGRLKAAGLRITRPRLAILSEMIRLGAPASIEQIHTGAGRCDLVTVYRCMAALEAIGLVRRAAFVGGSWLYAIRLGGEPRYHVVCRTTRRVDEVDAVSAAAITEALRLAEERLRERGYTQVGHTLEFFGVTAPAPRPPA
jgi:Fur family ferric uptake transcriptional regulator